MCRPAWLGGFLGTAYFIGYVCTLLWVPQFADKYGRKKIFAYGMAVQSVFYTILMFTQHYYVMLMVTFCFGALASIRQVTGFIYFLEMMPQRSNATAGSVFSIFDGTAYLIVVIYFWVISKDWFYVVLIGYVLQIVGAVLAWTLPEAPPYLFSVHRYEDAIGVFQKMKNYNKAPYSPVWDQL